MKSLITSIILLTCAAPVSQAATPGPVTRSVIERTVEYLSCGQNGWQLLSDRSDFKVLVGANVSRVYYNELAYGLFISSPLLRQPSGWWTYSRTLHGPQTCYGPDSPTGKRILANIQMRTKQDHPVASFQTQWAGRIRYQQVRSKRTWHYYTTHSDPIH